MEWKNKKRKREESKRRLSSSIIVWYYIHYMGWLMPSLPSRPLFPCHLIDRAKILKKNERTKKIYIYI
jgi:hypothetical protein